VQGRFELFNLQGYFMRGMFKTWIVLLGLLQSSMLAGVLFSEDFEKGIGKRWEPVKFEGATQYKIAKEQGNSVLQGYANGTASGLGVKLSIPVKGATAFSWRWKIDHTPKGGSDDEKKTFDHTARIFVAFKTMIGPPRTINYVWANNIAVGKSFHHPSSNRARFIVLEQGDGKAGKWLNYSRDLAADWKTLFGDDETPNVVSVGLMTDSDGTQTSVTGWFDDFLIATK
jgi:hypothetical protein